MKLVIGSELTKKMLLSKSMTIPSFFQEYVEVMLIHPDGALI